MGAAGSAHMRGRGRIVSAGLPTLSRRKRPKPGTVARIAKPNTEFVFDPVVAHPFTFPIERSPHGRKICLFVRHGRRRFATRKVTRELHDVLRGGGLVIAHVINCARDRMRHRRTQDLNDVVDVDARKHLAGLDYSP